MPEATERLSDEEIARLRTLAEGEPVPPCRVCGNELSIASMEGGVTKYACTDESGRPSGFENKDDGDSGWAHYRASSYRHYRAGDYNVQLLLDERELLLAEIAGGSAPVPGKAAPVYPEGVQVWTISGVPAREIRADGTQACLSLPDGDDDKQDRGDIWLDEPTVTVNFELPRTIA